ncbi:MAG: membrane integrity-associated transporter subunit PqiC [Gammaproteobacteria bacterium]|nr:membrane integrity-associated transporter subunit PqiC [Gammaproteobacteria bacterium]
MTLLALVAGCAGLHSNRAVTQTYVLAPPAASAPAGPPGAVTLQVLRPLAAPGLDTDQIALLRAGQRLDYYAASRWPAALPDLLQTLAVDALRTSGRFRAVQPDATAFAADDVLQIEIRHCEAVYAAEAAPVVRVELLATLGHQGDRALIGTVSAASEIPAGANRMQAVVAAFQEAVNRALAQLAAGLAP